MPLRTRLLLALWMLVLPLFGQVNLADAREVDAMDELKTVPERVEAFELLTQELQAINTEEVVSNCRRPLARSAPARPAGPGPFAQGAGHADHRRSRRSIDLLSEAIDDWNSDADDEGLCRLFMERGLTAAKVSSLGRKVDGILDDLYAALDIAETLEDLPLRLEVHDKLGYAYGRPAQRRPDRHRELPVHPAQQHL